MAPTMIDRTGISGLRGDTAEKILSTLYGAHTDLENAGRVRRNPGKPRGTDRHAWQKGLTIAEAIRYAAEDRGFTRRIEKKAIDVFRAVYTERYIRRNGLEIIDFGAGFKLDQIDEQEFDTREILRTLASARKQVWNHLYKKGWV